MSLFAEQSPKQTPDSGLADSSENLEIKIQSKFPSSKPEFLQTCHFLCLSGASNGSFHNAPSISPSAGLLKKQETSHHFKGIANPTEIPVVTVRYYSEQNRVPSHFQSYLHERDLRKSDRTARETQPSQSWDHRLPLFLSSFAVWQLKLTKSLCLF